MRGTYGYLVLKFETFPTGLCSGPIFTRWKSNVFRTVRRATHAHAPEHVCEGVVALAHDGDEHAEHLLLVGARLAAPPLHRRLVLPLPLQLPPLERRLHLALRNADCWIAIIDRLIAIT